MANPMADDYGLPPLPKPIIGRYTVDLSSVTNLGGPYHSQDLSETFRQSLWRSLQNFCLFCTFLYAFFALSQNIEYHAYK